MKICIIGSGYVGLVTGACFADLGNDVLCVDNNELKIKSLKKGIIPIYEPGLEELVKRNMKGKRLSFGTSVKDAVKRSEVIFIAVNTPPKKNGEADLKFVENVAREVALTMGSYRLIVEKSTVPVNTGQCIENTIKTYNKRNIKFDVASNPEFLREGSAINDFMHPDRVVIGVGSKKSEKILTDLYKPLGAPIVVTDIRSAELIKHASNSFLATKISFINAISVICDKTGADISYVSKGMGLDPRIGKDCLRPGIGFGGSCFPKDLFAFIGLSEKAGYNFNLLKEVQKINNAQIESVLNKIETMVWNLDGKTVSVLGLSFKPNTDDIRNAPALRLVSMLQNEGVKVKVYDPKCMEKSKKVLSPKTVFCKDAYAAVKGSDCMVVATEWSEFKELDLSRVKGMMRQPVIVDGRNIYDPEKVKKMGFKYAGMGRR